MGVSQRKSEAVSHRTYINEINISFISIKSSQKRLLDIPFL